MATHPSGIGLCFVYGGVLCGCKPLCCISHVKRSAKPCPPPAPLPPVLRMHVQGVDLVRMTTPRGRPTTNKIANV